MSETLTAVDTALLKTIGAQVVLSPDSAVAVAAKGGMDTIAGNVLLRDAGYQAMGLDPVSPSGGILDKVLAPEESHDPVKILAALGVGEQPKVADMPEEVQPQEPEAPPAPPA